MNDIGEQWAEEERQAKLRHDLAALPVGVPFMRVYSVCGMLVMEPYDTADFAQLFRPDTGDNR